MNVEFAGRQTDKKDFNETKTEYSKYKNIKVYSPNIFISITYNERLYITVLFT